jgi:hypothetical protein
MLSMLLASMKATLHNITRFVYLVVSVANFDNQNDAAFHDRNILRDLLTKRNFESSVLK